MRKLTYRYDDGLEFLQYCTNDELNFFVELYKNEAKTTERLTSEQKYKKYYPNHQEYWELLVAELQYFGGNTLSNITRGTGVLYKEILQDVCLKEYINFDENADIAQIEKVFIYEYLNKTIVNMKKDERILLKKSFSLSDIDEVKFLNEVKKNIFSNDVFFQNISTNILNSLGKNIFKQGIKVAVPLMGKQFAPIGIFFTAKDITDPAFRITLPSVIYISYLRNKYRKYDLKYRHRFYPKIGSIVRTDLVGGVIDHSGIYIGEGKIIEITEKDGKGCVEVIDLYDFTYGTSIRTGVSIYVAIDKLSKEIIFDNKVKINAEKYLGFTNKYELLKNNCHSFVHKCIIDEQFEVITDVWKFQHLTQSIERYMNKNRSIRWVVCDINPREYANKKKKIWNIKDEIL